MHIPHSSNCAFPPHIPWQSNVLPRQSQAQLSIPGPSHTPHSSNSKPLLATPSQPLQDVPSPWHIPQLSSSASPLQIPKQSSKASPPQTPSQSNVLAWQSHSPSEIPFPLHIPHSSC